jgi:hypothetical protein
MYNPKRVSDKEHMKDVHAARRVGDALVRKHMKPRNIAGAVDKASVGGGGMTRPAVKGKVTDAGYSR